MTGIEHRPCYGRLFPNPPQVTNDPESRGKVFSLVTVSPPGMIRTRPVVQLDMNAWDDCLRCPEFDDCYRLSMARLALDTATAGR
jgi:hypothetical protein